MMNLEKNRAVQIIESLGVIEVKCADSPVWIESIRGNIADVTNLETNKKMEVPISELHES